MRTLLLLRMTEATAAASPTAATAATTKISTTHEQSMRRGGLDPVAKLGREGLEVERQNFHKQIINKYVICCIKCDDKHSTAL
jgi:hypothetical protein